MTIFSYYSCCYRIINRETVKNFSCTILIMLSLSFSAKGQNQEFASDSTTLSFEEYIGYVKQYHPIVKQAELVSQTGEATVLKARGGFDPKLEIDYNTKEFKGTEYYDLLNSTFTVPTWFGAELKANFERNTGDFLNAQNIVPDDGLFAAGLSLPIAQGLLINERMASLRKAKLFREQTNAEQDILVNAVLFEASIAYFDWLQSFSKMQVYQDFKKNAEVRFQGIRSSALAGDIPAIDTVEAKITVQNRNLQLEQARIQLLKSSLQVSNYLWIGSNIPMQLRENVIPVSVEENQIDSTLRIDNIFMEDFNIMEHPKVKALSLKVESLNVERRLKRNNLLPIVNLEYNFITAQPEIARSFNSREYKAGLYFRFPLFLRKERGDLKLVTFKMQDQNYELLATQLELTNKITAIYTQIQSLEEQKRLISDIVEDYAVLLKAEERKFSFGESSVFLINSRENKLIDARLKRIETWNKYYEAKAKLFNNLAINPKDL